MPTIRVYLKITIILCSILFQLTFNSVGHAGVTLDGTMGTKGPLTGPNYTITPGMGKQVGGNLFQSFTAFNINTGESATFTGPNSIQNLISRVTGGSASNIDGTLRSDIQGANFYFINPSGVMFGPNATLDVSGSFYVSTADYLKLGDSGRFDAKTPANSVLISAPPSAFGFLSDMPKGIAVNGSFLQVPQGKNISLVGGDINIQNGTLYAPAGTINLISAASLGEATIIGNTFNTDGFGKMGTINIADNRDDSERPVNNDAYVIGNVDVSDAGGGDVYIRGGQFVMDKGYIFADTFGDTDGRGIDIKITGESRLGNFSWITAHTYGKGKAGDITIDTDNLVLTGAAEISTSALTGSEGNGGDIKVTARDTVSISGHYDSGQGVYSSGLVSETFGKSSAGSITIDTNKLSITDGGYVSTSAREGSDGDGGNIKIKALDMVSISGHYDSNSSNYSSGIFSETFGKGKAGDITIETGNLNIADVGRITTSARAGSEGNGGNISVTAWDTVSISGHYDSGQGVFSSGLTSETFGKGSAGNITIDTGILSITEAGSITTSAREGSEGNAGNISVTAWDTVSISGHYDSGQGVFSSGLTSETFGKGSAGNIMIDTGILSITDAGAITTSARAGSEGNGGNISVTAHEKVSISGNHDSGSSNYSSVITSETFGKGSAGNITIDTNNLSITEDGSITTSARAGSEGDGGNITIKAADTVSISGHHILGDNIFFSGIFSETYGKGKGGDIVIETGNLNITDAGRITTSARAGSEGNGGNISVTAKDQVLISGNHDSGGSNYSSGIFSETYGKGKAGDITIGTGNLNIADDGRITTSARAGSAGDAGNISVAARDTVSISGHYDSGQGVFSSGLTSETFGKGSAGNITIDTNNLSITEDGSITTSAREGSEGDGGNITIKAADTVSISGHYDSGQDVFFSGIFSETEGKGKAGDILIETGNLSITDAGRITTSSRTGSEGNGGNISVMARDTVSISGHYDSGQGVFSSGIRSETFGKGSAGNITIDTGILSITEAGRITTSARAGSEGNGGNISVTARDRVSISGSHDSGGSNYPSVITSETFGKGSAGNIMIDTNNLSITGDGSITTSARTGSVGDGGNITIKAADMVSISGHHILGDNIFFSGIFSETYGKGKGGDVTIETGKLDITDTGRITTSARAGSEGKGGDITISAKDTVSVSGHYDSGKGVYSSSMVSETFGKGKAGNITIETGNLNLTDAGTLTATARQGSGGDAGNITVKAADSVLISDYYDNGRGVYASGILSETYGRGNAGNISIETWKLSILQNGYITTSAYEGSGGDAGNITVRATDSVLISDYYDNGQGVYASSISSETFGKGKGGNISIETGKLALSKAGYISTDAREGSEGDAGNITLKTTDSVLISDHYDNVRGAVYQSVITSATYGSGKAGNISVSTPLLTMADRGGISTSTSYIGAGGNIEVSVSRLQMNSNAAISSESTGTGVAGSITINATDSIRLQDSSITAATENADGGNIQIQANNMLHLIDSDITSTVKGGTGNGGNIAIDTAFVILDNSKVIANADRGNGGNILIDAKVYLASPNSLVSASSNLGLPGTVDISAPLIDISGNLAVLPSSYLDVNALVPKKCTERETEMSSFVVKGRDGIPPQPDSLLTSP